MRKNLSLISFITFLLVAFLLVTPGSVDAKTGPTGQNQIITESGPASGHTPNKLEPDRRLRIQVVSSPSK